DENPDADQLESECHAPTPGAQVLEGSSTGRARSIGDGPVVLAPADAAECDEPFEMRERLGDCETPLDRRQLLAEQIVRDVVAAARLRAERCFSLVEAVRVVAGAPRAAGGRLGDRLPVSAVRGA